MTDTQYQHNWKVSNDFSVDCVKRLYQVYNKYHLLWDKEVDAHKETKIKLAELEYRLSQQEIEEQIWQ